MELRARGLVHPLPLTALAVLVTNDHVLKGAGLLPGWLTGKLSDVAGLFLFPLVLAALARRLLPRIDGRTLAAWCAVATAVGFALVKLSPAWNAAATALLGATAPDPTDLVALPMVALSASFARRSSGAGVAGAPARVWLERGALVLAAVACMATSRPMQVRNYPMWEIGAGEPAPGDDGKRRDPQGLPADATIGCASVRAFVAKSGKEGVGLGVRVDSTGGACEVALDGRLSAGDVTVAAATRVGVGRGGREHAYLAFAFDNERLWNDGVRDGALALTVTAGGASRVLSYPIHQRFDGFHRWDRPDHAPRPPMEVATGPMTPATAVTPATPASAGEGAPR